MALPRRRALFAAAPPALRVRVWRPQLKREPLGSTEVPMLGTCLSILLLAQAPESTYDRYALRLVYGPGSTGVVRGIQAEAVGGGTFVPGVDLLATADDSVRLQYRASRASFKRYALLGGLSIAGTLATMNYYGDHL